MLHNGPHALGDNSNPIDGHRWTIDAHRNKLRWPSMGLNGVSVSVCITAFPNKIFGHPRNPKQSLNRLKNLNGESVVEILNMANSNEFL